MDNIEEMQKEEMQNQQNEAVNTGEGTVPQEPQQTENDVQQGQEQAGEADQNSAVGTQPTGEEQQTEESAAAPADPSQNVPEGTAEEQEKMIPQSEVNKILQKRLSEVRQKAREEAYAEAKQTVLNDLASKYGLDNGDGLDELFGNGQKYDVLNEEYGAQSSELANLKAENALLQSGIDRSRFDDVKAWMAYNHTDVNPMTIEQALTTHPEWKSGTVNEAVASGVGLDQASAERPSVIKKLGGEPNTPAQGDSEKEQAMKMMGL